MYEHTATCNEGRKKAPKRTGLRDRNRDVSDARWGDGCYRSPYRTAREAKPSPPKALPPAKLLCGLFGSEGLVPRLHLPRCDAFGPPCTPYEARASKRVSNARGRILFTGPYKGEGFRSQQASPPATNLDVQYLALMSDRTKPLCPCHALCACFASREPLLCG